MVGPDFRRVNPGVCRCNGTKSVGTRANCIYSFAAEFGNRTRDTLRWGWKSIQRVRSRSNHWVLSTSRDGFGFACTGLARFRREACSQGSKSGGFVNVFSALLIHEFTADPGLQHLNVFKLFGRQGEHIAINDDEIRQFASLQ